MGMDHEIMELCYKGTILQRNYSHNYLVEFYVKKNWEPQHGHVISDLCYYLVMAMVTVNKVSSVCQHANHASSNQIL